ncbi:hypothetical protein SARC_02092 [Sphaeroforma arctica JP610]|uniref:Uncharacterized protein n=1 Tax=Sphaeroforma arctica JP610 TaxID=667725 RepID=A0A0L0GBU0_9EUKA|nr:hypothetical protein SARC_02092 [Sphaeroforma arctica JP610]KNC85718.1 hypothetical protein SARC_02092 [Sphaeroforma arctica JP610]|eukprot:XP_014159620.1 hypothetical protein SARC_02092 [Sphaeroforma arctica JP610]
MQTIDLPDHSAPIIVSGWGQLNTELVADIESARQSEGENWREGAQLRLMVTIYPCDDSYPAQVFYSKLLITEAWDWFRFEPLNIIPSVTLSHLTVGCVLRNAPTNTIGFCDDISVTQGEHVDLDESQCVVPETKITEVTSITDVLDNNGIPSEALEDSWTSDTVDNTQEENIDVVNDSADDVDEEYTLDQVVTLRDEQTEYASCDFLNRTITMTSSSSITTATTEKTTEVTTTVSGTPSVITGSEEWTTTAAYATTTETATVSATDAGNTISDSTDDTSTSVIEAIDSVESDTQLYVDSALSEGSIKATATSEASACTCGWWSEWTADCQITEEKINPDGSACGSGIITRHKVCNELCQAPKVISYRKCSVVCHPMAELVVTDNGEVSSDDTSSATSIALIVSIVSGVLFIILVAMTSTHLWRSRRRRRQREALAKEKEANLRRSQPLPAVPIKGPIMMAGVLVTVEEASEEEDNSTDNYSIDMDEENEENNSKL